MIVLLCLLAMTWAQVPAAPKRTNTKAPQTSEEALHLARQQRLLAEIARNRKSSTGRALGAKQGSTETAGAKMRAFIKERFPEFQPTHRAEETPAERAQRRMAERDAILARVDAGVAMPQVSEIVEKALRQRPADRPPLREVVDGKPQQPDLWFEISKEERERAQEKRQRALELRRLADEQMAMDAAAEEEALARKQEAAAVPDVPVPKKKKPAFRQPLKQRTIVPPQADTARVQAKRASIADQAITTLKETPPQVLAGGLGGVCAAVWFVWKVLLNKHVVLALALASTISVMCIAVAHFAAARQGRSDFQFVDVQTPILTAARALSVLLCLVVRRVGCLPAPVMLIAWIQPQGPLGTDPVHAACAVVAAASLMVLVISGIDAKPAATIPASPMVSPVKVKKEPKEEPVDPAEMMKQLRKEFQKLENAVKQDPDAQDMAAQVAQLKKDMAKLESIKKESNN